MTDPAVVDLSTGPLAFTLHAGVGLRLERLALGGLGWATLSSPVFALEADGRRIAGGTPGLAVRGLSLPEAPAGVRHTTVHLAHEQAGLAIDYHARSYAGAALLETWIVVRNTGERPARVTRLDSLALDLPAASYELLSFTGSWGLEFEPRRTRLDAAVTLESRAGRSSKGDVPWLTLARAGGGLLSAAPVWSGNWAMRLEPLQDGGYRLSGGLNDWEFFAELAPGESIAAPPVALALAAGGDTNALSTQYARVGRAHWYPRNALSEALPVEWNHWWSYEDKTIDEATFRANVDAAARLGVEVCTLDAGWFGPTDPATHWYDYRGDWDMVNSARFPSGIRALADYTHAAGMKFGLWCEIEGLGGRARLAERRPELVATRGGERLGYVCLGSPAGQEWAFETLERLIVGYGADWIKLDFNLDPGAGCDRTDHGHGAGDGLYAHYRGYERLLERVRARYPEVVLENCSSGGLRIDLAIARQTHMAFLSDPDWPEHSLQCFWGVSELLAPGACLHWSYCDWAHARHRHQTFDPRDPRLQPHQLDYYTRISMLHRYGFSQKLPDLPPWVAQRLAHHTRVYKDLARRFVRDADLLRLTGQPRRFGEGERWAAFQYAMPDGGEHLLFVFRLHGGEAARSVRLARLDPARAYTLTWEGEARQERRTGAELMEVGLACADLPEEGSALIHLG
ncbi:MAG TPA: alpha-galactosidase [Roseiflexaceae bacterium]|nr:alpha-galactosidase [Roseiflexaceae bacterium]